MLRIGLTGGIGSGKTTVANLFADLGVPIIDTDEIARSLTHPAQPAYEQIVRSFGRGILDAGGEIDRARLRALVFNDVAQRRTLESILHPRIHAEVARRVAALTFPYCVIVVPLLIEAHFRDLVDRVLVVDCEEATQVQRVAARSALSETEIRAIMASQLSRAARLKHADDTIRNDAGLEALRAAVQQQHQQYLALAGVQA
jgi:dephospho-CoA kinase